MEKTWTFYVARLSPSIRKQETRSRPQIAGGYCVLPESGARISKQQAFVHARARQYLMPVLCDEHCLLDAHTASSRHVGYPD